MNTEHLVIMANDIGNFFVAYPDAEQAKRDIVNHIKNFWNPVMRKAIVKHIENGGEGLLPLVQTAIQQNQQLLA
jgi:formate dehydrogenase subunit delta